MSDQTSGLAHALLSALSALPVRRGDRALVAVSGGADSLALADLLHRTRDVHGIELVLAHVDHGIHPESGAAAAVVASFAAERGLPLHVRRLGLGALAGETVARERRY
ncbi:MAG: tRNA(Ile)-lysidine synthetase, partial [Gemmatimonadota bacterium]|nr:tRNA(Ile)-lysidine synthetase [Gemmatimonadota bacterium]